MEMVGVRVGHQHGVEPSDISIEELLAEVRGGIDQDYRRTDLDQHRHPAATITPIFGIATAPIRPDRRHAGRRAAAEDGHPHLAGGRTLPNRRKKLAVVTAASTSGSSPLRSATAAAVAATNAGSLRLPRCGTGAR